METNNTYSIDSANTITVRAVTLYWQTDAETGGNKGWAYNVIDRDGEHTSGGIEVDDDDDGSESLSDVAAAFTADFPAAAAQIARWNPLPEGGWRGETE